MTSSKKTVLFSWISGLLACGLCLSTAQAATTAGTVAAFKGEVQAVSASGTERPLRSAAAVYVGDTIRTGPGSYVVVEFVDGARTSVRPNSELRIDRYAYGTGEDGALMSLIKGGLRTITGGIAHQRPESYKVKTAVATLGVRGTEFELRLCAQDCSAEAQRIAGASQGLEGEGFTIIE